MTHPIFKCRDLADVKKAVAEYNVEFIQIWFVDILGNLKCLQITYQELENAFEEGVGFDGSSILGFTRIEESDMIAFPDPTTFQILWWQGRERPVARVFCDIRKPTGEPYEGDPRYVLRRLLKKASDQGYTFNVGPELEFFLFESSHSPKTLDDGGFFDAPPLDQGVQVRYEIIDTLQEMGIQVEFSHHENSPSQHEIDLRYGEAMYMADVAMTYKVVAKEIAQRNNCFASFMPKPLFGVNGSGMHVHQSLFKDGRNAFYDKDDKYHLSHLAKCYMAGLLKHAKEYCCITNQWVTSYKRLVPGYEAPVYIAWAQRNRSAFVRVPMYKLGKENATRMELRCPDPAANPYLAFAVMLAAGLKGVEENYVLPEAIEANIYAMEDDDLDKFGIDCLPGSLHEAAMELKKSVFMREVLGPHLHDNLVGNKLIEWDQYRTHVSEFELDKYLPIL